MRSRASKELRRSSISSQRMPKRPCRRREKRAARSLIALGVPSMLSGNPTSSSTGPHSPIRRRMRSQSGTPSRAGSTGSAVAVPVSALPTATPMRRRP